MIPIKNKHDIFKANRCWKGGIPEISFVGQLSSSGEWSFLLSASKALKCYTSVHPDAKTALGLDNECGP